MVLVITQNTFNSIHEILYFTSSNTKIEKIFEKKLVKKKSKKNNEKYFYKKKIDGKKIPHNFLMVFRAIKNDPGGPTSLK